ncbi:BZ3500_MvSof-1268-A1-R1_Chr3-1g06044 [Microbotryum saponariae]|uniref:BZ3500_MvSof-1268-A1-R1_Chr3-1g06044 protein n=1 Tax=Microbotryum saponariae TaxID=289078 RepID=A0A2X0M418_9BASI|nr:BZ3500_MvSof-1268-A1-R1_Chr3-1g06044 [Microbotryum saponariae]SDA03855.1 BZ3501_MvSof-1269-A2-R1_Chr3-2g05729 [Microbotryum saponariae]
MNHRGRGARRVAVVLEPLGLLSLFCPDAASVYQHLILPNHGYTKQVHFVDAVDLLQAVLEGEDEFDVNYQDGLGNTGAYWLLRSWVDGGNVERVGVGGAKGAAMQEDASTPSPEVLEILLETEGTDVDLQNRLDKATPLHLAAQLEHPAARQGVMEMLLDAGADPKIKDKHGSLPADYLHPDESEEDRQIIAMIDESIVDATLIDDADIAEDDDEEEGGGSESD